VIDIIEASAEILGENGFATARSASGDTQFLTFENGTILGFLFAYDDPARLAASWENDADRAVATHQLGLRRAGQKAWNAYTVLLARQEASFAQSTVLGTIEESLVGTRKIARAGITDMSELRAALLPLLPLQAAPKLDAVDMVEEIRLRTTELPPRALEAFFSGADETAIMQVLEEAP